MDLSIETTGPSDRRMKDQHEDQPTLRVGRRESRRATVAALVR